MLLAVLVLAVMAALVLHLQSREQQQLVGVAEVVELTRVAQLVGLVVLEEVAMLTLLVITQILEQQTQAAAAVVPAVLPWLAAYSEEQVAQES
jgi:hypothetical protein